jgi:primosomal protein N' (replication factor Y)
VAVRGAAEDKVLGAVELFAEQLKTRLPPSVQVAGPAPAPLARAKGLFRYQIILRAPTTQSMTAPLKALMKEFKWPAGVSFAVDVDAVSLM